MDERGIEDALVMDRKTFKSLTSETRTQILKLLKKRNHTLSELAEKLKISKTTAKEHIDVLLKGRLIEPVPSTNKWKYYTLTEDGKKLVGGEGPKRVVILITTAIIGMLLAAYSFIGLVSPLAGESPIETAGEIPEDRSTEEEKTTGEGSYAETATPAEAEPAEEAPDEGQYATTTPQTLINPYPLLFLGIVGFIITGTSLLLLLRRKGGGII